MADDSISTRRRGLNLRFIRREKHFVSCHRKNMSVSAYEQLRLDNIASNNAVLAALGLSGDNSLKEKNSPVTPLRKVPV